VFITSRSNARSLASPRPSDSSLARRQLALELLDLGTGGVSKALVQGVAGFDLTGVDQQRARAREAAALVVIVPEEKSSRWPTWKAARSLPRRRRARNPRSNRRPAWKWPCSGTPR
jgi:hypothetical protein